MEPETTKIYFKKDLKKIYNIRKIILFNSELFLN